MGRGRVGGRGEGSQRGLRRLPAGRSGVATTPRHCASPLTPTHPAQPTPNTQHALPCLSLVRAVGDGLRLLLAVPRAPSLRQAVDVEGPSLQLAPHPHPPLRRQRDQLRTPTQSCQLAYRVVVVCVKGREGLEGLRRWHCRRTSCECAAGSSRRARPGTPPTTSAARPEARGASSPTASWARRCPPPPCPRIRNRPSAARRARGPWRRRRGSSPTRTRRCSYPRRRAAWS